MQKEFYRYQHKTIRYNFFILTLLTENLPLFTEKPKLLRTVQRILKSQDRDSFS